jgi:peptide/nickel transport system substrate-binding protein
MNEIETINSNLGEGRISRRQILKSAGALGALMPISGLLSPILLSEAGAAKPGGTLRVGTPFGAASVLDPHVAPPGNQDVMRNFNVFDLLFWYDKSGKLYPKIAESCESNKSATVWTLKIKSGVKFHDGSTLTVDDVIYSIKRIQDPKTAAEARSTLAMIDGSLLRRIDAYTLEIPMLYPYSILPNQFATKGVSIIKAGTTSFESLNGTGPYKYVSGDAQKVILSRNANCWIGGGRPYLDTVEIINVPDAAARLNGLKTGALDTIYPTTAADGKAVASDSNIIVFTSQTGTMQPLLMNAKLKPFNDPNVRLAMKLATDRTTMNRLSYDGKGKIGNDMFGVFDSGYPKDLKQRAYDPEKAKALWKKAGLEKSTLKLYTADIWPAQITHSTVFAQQAKKAGIKVQVVTQPADQYFTKGYGVQAFHNEYWNYRPILTLWNACFNLDSGDYQYTSWATEKATKLFKAAAAQGDPKKRDEITREMMLIFHNDGPYVVWAFETSQSLYSSKIGGQENSPIRSLNGFDFSGFFVK